ncbi:MerR family transcriptional regulator [Streptomyces sp. Je 1-79]|uniref:MerR family transcriptional regulator n=1 Tax=Streptomyces sp. Je 1-79 TaxID=2943847 RepID=UPI0021A45BD2|nr:MerR family transcriptional regulator [Streptomyces sp. Je 1-79]MCT4356219.1 MerR family transcriptional regulator [Streptomyces sp. Je 1-79]
MSAAGPTGRRARPRTVPTELAALAMGVPPATIRKWASRGKLTRHGTPQRAEYDLEELRALAAGNGRGQALG